jgi:hypothetical protein
MLSKRIRPFGSRNRDDIADCVEFANFSISFVVIPCRSLFLYYLIASLPSIICTALSFSLEIKPANILIWNNIMEEKKIAMS